MDFRYVFYWRQLKIVFSPAPFLHIISIMYVELEMIVLYDKHKHKFCTEKWNCSVGMAKAKSVCVDEDVMTCVRGLTLPIDSG